MSVLSAAWLTLFAPPHLGLTRALVGLLRGYSWIKQSALNPPLIHLHFPAFWVPETAQARCIMKSDYVCRTGDHTRDALYGPAVSYR